MPHTILNTGRMHDHGKEEILSIDRNVALATFDFLAGMHSSREGIGSTSEYD
jgi:hypothetical protein